MTVAITPVNAASGADTFQVLINRVNHVINVVSNNAVTADGSSNGSLTTGNAYVNGIAAALTVAAGTLRGGNTQATANLVIASNVSVGNSTANVFIGYGNVTVSTIISVGSALTINTSVFALGNSTVNAVVNSSMVALSGVNVVTTAVRTKVSNNGTLIGTRDILNLIAGNNVALDITDHSVGGQVNVVISSTANGGAVVAGSNTQVQYNDSGNLGGSAGFTFNQSSNNLVVANTLHAAILSLDSGNVQQQHITLTTTGTSAQLFDSWALNTWRTGKYVVSIKNNSANGYSASELIVLQDDGDVYLSEYGVIQSNGSLGVWSANANSTAVRLYMTPVPANTTIRSHRSLLAI